MMRSLYSGVSGLRAHQTRMDVIGNNIANVNTNGFKYSRVTFAETFAQTIKSAVAPTSLGGGSNPQQVGLGTQVATIDTIFTQGSLSQTGRVTDLAIQGNGFFVLADKAGSGARAYSRDGNFSIDGDGYLVTASGGQVLQGWMADSNGIINNSRPLQNIRMPINGSIEAKATTEVRIAGNFGSPSQLNVENAAAILQAPVPTGAIPMAGPNPGSVTLAPGNLMINDISITGTIQGSNPPNSLSDLRKLADLINAKTSLTNVFATVKDTSAGPRLVLTSNQIGPLSEIKLDSNLPAGVLGQLGLPSTGLPLTTTIYTEAQGSVDNGFGVGVVPDGSVAMISGDLIVNGVDLGPLPATNATNTSEQNAQAIAALFNAKSALTGVSAETDGAGRVLLKGAARDIILTGTAQGQAIASFAIDGANAGRDNRARTATTIAGTSMDIYDAQGSTHTININYMADFDVLEDANGFVTGTRLDGNWRWAGFATDPNMVINSQDARGNETEHLIQFNNDGVLKGYSNGQLTISYINSNSTPPPQTIRLTAGTIGTTEGVTQFGGYTSVDGNGQDGYAAGELINFGVERNGTLTGIYTNGVTKPIAQLAMATFANPEGLYRSGDTSQVRGASNSFSESPNSGPARIGIANTGNRGEIRGGQLELSNVDLSQQFTDMIITQRGFQANSRSITTSDEMLQEVVNLKR